jgi:hypothetical protein
MTTEWHYDELVELCKLKHKRDPTDHWDSLNWHDDLAHFYANKGREAWEDYARAGYSHDAYKKAVFSFEAYVVACVQSLNPMADLLGQINDVIFNHIQTKERVQRVYLVNLKKKMLPTPGWISFITATNSARECIFQ